MAAHQAPPSLRFSRQEYWSGLPFPSPMHESEKWKWSRSVVSNSQRHHGLQPTRLLRPWDFPGKSTGVGCHCLLCKYLGSNKSKRKLTYSGTSRLTDKYLCLSHLLVLIGFQATTTLIWLEKMQRKRYIYSSTATLKEEKVMEYLLNHPKPWHLKMDEYVLFNIKFMVKHFIF